MPAARVAASHRDRSSSPHGPSTAGCIGPPGRPRRLGPAARRRAPEKAWGLMRLKPSGGERGRERAAILGYLEDGPNLVTMAMNGWGAPEPAWWLNLQAQPPAPGRRATGHPPAPARA